MPLHACGYHEYGYDDQSSDVMRFEFLFHGLGFYNDPMRNADQVKNSRTTLSVVSWSWMISCSAVTQRRTWLFILGSLEAQKGMVPFSLICSLIFFSKILKHSTGNLFVFFPQNTLPISNLYFAYSCGMRAVGVSNIEAVTQHKPLMAHSWRAALGWCNSESSPRYKDQLLK